LAIAAAAVYDAGMSGVSGRSGFDDAARLLAAALACVPLAACSSAPEPVAFQNPIFYQYDSLAGSAEAQSLEQRYPPLDKSEAPPLPEYTGVAVLGGAVRISRPRDWVIRAGSLRPERRYVEWVSPNQYVVAVYELAESPDETWRDVMARYEEQATKSGAELLGAHVPMATYNAQGRAYFVRRAVPAAKAPLVNHANEYLLRSSRRIVLLQIVHHDPDLDPIGAELRRVVETLQVD
jgi:hypothetical protein